MFYEINGLDNSLNIFLGYFMDNTTLLVLVFPPNIIPRIFFRP